MGSLGPLAKLADLKPCVARHRLKAAIKETKGIDSSIAIVIAE